MKKKGLKVIVSVGVLGMALLFVAPFYLLFMNAFKPIEEILQSFMDLPKHFTLNNFKTAWELTNFPVVFCNTLIVASGTALGTVCLSSMAGFKLQRYSGKLGKALYYYFVIGMTFPIIVMMIPLVQMLRNLGMLNNLLVLILVYIATNLPFTVFSFYGFAQNIPRELEEAASIDGCGALYMFFRVIFPLLMPAAVTMGILVFLWTWNDFGIAYLLINERSLRTLTMNIYMFVGDRMVEWDKFIACLAMSILPSIIVYIFAQKYIEKGVVAGAVKG